jgi:hypothetical protein
MIEHKEVGTPPNLKIEKMFAFVSQEGEGEGVMAAMTQDGTWMPLVGADMSRVKALVPVANDISKATGRPYKIYEFSNKKDITEEIKNGK